MLVTNETYESLRESPVEVQDFSQTTPPSEKNLQNIPRIHTEWPEDVHVYVTEPVGLGNTRIDPDRWMIYAQQQTLPDTGRK